jgi:DNA-binding transcriptional regulator GbsR (MarR family)
LIDNPDPPAPDAAEPAAWQRQFVEQVGLYADVGLPRSLARVLAWLVVCEPHHQSAEQLRAVLKLSSGAVSSATRMLVRFGIVARISFPGDRRIYYELHPDGWHRLMRIRLQELAGVRHVAEEAMQAAHGQDDERLRGMRDFYADCEVQFAKLLNGEADAMGKQAPVRGRRRKPAP